MRGPVACLFGIALALACAAPVAAARYDDGLAAYRKNDFRTAFKTLLPLAEAGDARAQYLVGRHYQFGQGVKVDRANAYFWYRRAETQGHLEARLFRQLLEKRWKITAAEKRRAELRLAELKQSKAVAKASADAKKAEADRAAAAKAAAEKRTAEKAAAEKAAAERAAAERAAAAKAAAEKAAAERAAAAKAAAERAKAAAARATVPARQPAPVHAGLPRVVAPGSPAARMPAHDSARAEAESRDRRRATPWSPQPARPEDHGDDEGSDEGVPGRSSGDIAAYPEEGDRLPAETRSDLGPSDYSADDSSGYRPSYVPPAAVYAPPAPPSYYAPAAPPTWLPGLYYAPPPPAYRPGWGWRARLHYGHGWRRGWHGPRARAYFRYRRY